MTTEAPDINPGNPDQGNNLEQNQPPEGMQQVRILSTPSGVDRYTPPVDASPFDYIVLRYHDFRAVVSELAGGQLQAFQVFAQKLEDAVVQDARDDFQRATDTAKSIAHDVGYAAGVIDGHQIGYTLGHQTAIEEAQLQQEQDAQVAARQANTSPAPTQKSKDVVKTPASPAQGDAAGETPSPSPVTPTMSLDPAASTPAGDSTPA